MPGEPFSDRRHIRAHVRAAYALLDRLPAPDAGGNLLVSVKTEQFATRKNRLRFPGSACDKILHQHLAGKCISIEALQDSRRFALVARKPYAPARGADRSLDDARQPNGIAQLPC